jgi:hypothetical protein
MEQNHRGFRRSIFIPLILIIIGVVLLLYNLGFISGDIWEVIFSLWPLLLIALGLDSLIKGEGFVGSIFFIGLGAIFLSSTLGLVDISVWELILTLWPLLLVAIGLDIVIGRRSVAWSVVGVALFLLVLGGAIWLLYSPLGETGTGEEIYQQVEGASSAQVIIEPTIGNLIIRSHQDAEVLIQGEIRLGKRENVSPEFNIFNGEATFTLRSKGFAFFAFPGERRPWTWNLSLTPEIPLDIIAAIDVGLVRLDLTDINVNRMDLKVGVGDIRLILPSTGRLQADLENSVGSTTIILPPTMSLRLMTDTGLATVHVPGDFELQDGEYMSPGYMNAVNQVDLHIKQPIGVVRVIYAEERLGILTGLTNAPLHAVSLPGYHR